MCVNPVENQIKKLSNLVLLIMSKITFFLLKSLAVICLFLSVCSFMAPVHRFYLSLAEIRVDTKKQTLDVSCKLFTDDLEDLLVKKYGKKADLATSTKDKDVQALITKYMSENFKINVGGKLINLNFVGFETEADAIWIYLESVPFREKGTVTIFNTLLYDYLPEQSNMINIYWNDAEKSAKLVNPDKMAEFVF
jgi:hypothetical protein